MQIEQAFYGDARGAHSLLASSRDDEVSAEIVQRLDLPDTAPPRAEWSPFLRGFPHRDRYVLARTFRDTGASRGGMVFSHALLTPLEEIGETADLGPLLARLATSHRQRPRVETVPTVQAEKGTPEAADLFDAAEALSTSRVLPVVRLGHLGFDDLVVALWARLLPGIRRGFAFRLSFGPQDLVEAPRPTLVCTPHGMEARWSGHPIVRSPVRSETESLAAALLTGEKKANPLSEFMEEIGVEPVTFTQLRLLEQAYHLDAGEPTLERRVGSVRLIESLSSEPDAGRAGRDRRVRRLCGLLRSASAQEILVLRNLKLSAFPSSSRLWKALEAWVAESNYPEDQDVAMLSVLEDATTENAAVQEWRTAVLDGVALATGLPISPFATAFWRWLPVRPRVVAAVFQHVPDQDAVEERFTSATPNSLDEVPAAIVAAAALSRGWLRLHGALLSASCSALAAARKQLEVDVDPSFLEGLRAALRLAEPQELIECALEVNDPRVTGLAGEAVARAPRLLTGVDLTAAEAQAIWREALAARGRSSRAVRAMWLVQA